MNNFYLQQLLVALKQQEVEQARLRKQIGRSNSSLLALAVQALRNLLAARKKASWSS